MKTLRGRIGLALFAFAMATLLSVGGALWVALRDLHRDAALGSLAELTLPYVAQARVRFPDEILRPRFAGERPGSGRIQRFRDSQAGRRESEAFKAFVEQTQDEIAEAGISVLLIRDGGAVVVDPSTGQGVFFSSGPDVTVPKLRGTVETGTTTFAGMGDVLYAATPVSDSRSNRAIPALVLVREDDSSELATADLLRALSLAALVLLVIGVPLALGLSSSVTGPLRRLAAASGAVARGEVPEPLPTGGPAEVAHASEAFNTMASEVSATREAQRRFLADARHDLRTPLTVISGFAEALRDGTATGAAAHKAADAIADEAARLGRMLADLDHLTVTGETSQSFRTEKLDGLELAKAAVERFEAQAQSQEKEISLDPDAHSLTVLADRDAVDRILGNIVANALYHAPSPGGHVFLEVSAVDARAGPVGGPGGWSGAAGVVLAVRDDGPGIPLDALPHIFDRFYRADPSRSSPGSGLGLAIVRDLADALHGRAFAENLASGGARVGVVLPAAPKPAPKPAPKAAAKPVQGPKEESGAA